MATVSKGFGCQPKQKQPHGRRRRSDRNVIPGRRSDEWKEEKNEGGNVTELENLQGKRRKMELPRELMFNGKGKINVQLSSPSVVCAPHRPNRAVEVHANSEGVAETHANAESMPNRADEVNTNSVGSTEVCYSNSGKKRRHELSNLNPPTLLDSTALITGAEKKQLKKANKVRRRERQLAQAETSYWTTHNNNETETL